MSEAFVKTLPETIKSIAVLDRTKEPGAAGEPMYLDVQNAISEAVAEGVLLAKNRPNVVGGRYGLGSKEFNPGMAKSVLEPQISTRRVISSTTRKGRVL
jgi:pyruvate-ferredoxin/flavodoxin oxidoreductase